jgi:NAD-dependent dihydropyrimidine dehydrogenase PreA subunit
MNKSKSVVSVDYAKCKPCLRLTCIGVCPQGIFMLGNDGKPVIAEHSSCTLCEVCIDLCPENALSIKNEDKC